nr:L-fucokinase/GDP-L-fucose pyrophosphorylase [Tanacetum cinerariifolium]
VRSAMIDGSGGPYNGSFGVLDDLGILENDLWSTQEKCLWNAKLFPVFPYHAMLRQANWLMGLEYHDKNLGFQNLWRMSRRALNGNSVLKSRTYQVQADLLHACSYHEEAIKVEHQVWAAVVDETASAVRYGFKEHVFQSFGHIAVKEHGKNNVRDHVNQTFHHRKVKVELPVRVDFVGGIVHDKTLISTGLLVKTWAHIPRGSGLGTSSILAAAVVKGLLRISDGDEITHYLQRDNLLISSIKCLAELAKTKREALMNCNIDELGDIMMETWRLHQELDPHCSNEFVDSLFAFADRYCCGCKLVGDGGGGFALLLAKYVKNAQQLRQALEENNEFDVMVYN